MSAATPSSSSVFEFSALVEAELATLLERELADIVTGPATRLTVAEARLEQLRQLHAATVHTLSQEVRHRPHQLDSLDGRASMIGKVVVLEADVAGVPVPDLVPWWDEPTRGST